jgi:hypothetical protein
MNTVSQMEALGFDQTEDTGEGTLLIKCSRCEALVINGIATHERGCPNQTGECVECGAVVPKRQRLCEDCANPELLDE